MEVFHVALMRAGKIFDKSWKIHRAFIESCYKTSSQHVKFSKISKNFTKLYENMLKNFRKTSNKLTKTCKIFRKVYKKSPKGNSNFIVY